MDVPLFREHPVPRCLWSGGRPDGTVTVLTCKTCEAEFKKNEIFFRNSLVCLNGGKHYEAKALSQSSVIRGMARNHREFLELTATKRPIMPMPGYSRIWQVDTNWKLDQDRMGDCLRKVIKGLYCFKVGRPLDPQYTVVPMFIEGEWDDQEYASLMCDMSEAPWETYGDSVFKYRCAFGYEGDIDISIWAIVFYENVGFMGLTIPNSWQGC